METQSERIKRRRLECQLTQKALADKVGVSRVAITQWENDPSVQISGANLSRLAKSLGVPGNWILSGGALQKGNQGNAGKSQEHNVTGGPAMSGQVPLLSWVQAGAWTEIGHVEIDHDSTDWMPRPPGASPETFALRVVGESMAPRYKPGVIIFVDPEVQPENGDDVVCVMTESNEATFKRFINEPGDPTMLMALNEAWPQRFMEINGNCRLLGTVVADMNLRRR